MKCYLCESSNHKMIHKGVRGSSDTNVYKCLGCGLVFLADQTSDNINDFYERSGMWNSSTSGGDIESVRRMCYEDDNRRYKYVRPIIENKRLLDFGCGSGGFLHLARTAAKELAGVELESSMRNRLNEEAVPCFPSIHEAKTHVGRLSENPV